MTCNSMINTVLATPTLVAEEGTIPVGNAVHGYGKAIVLNGNGIALRTTGYYHILANFTLMPTKQEQVTVTAYIDGTAIPGAVATTPEVSADTAVNGSLQAVVLVPCSCAGRKTLTFTANASSTITNFSVIVEKE